MMRDDNPISFASEMINMPIDSRTSLIPAQIIYPWNNEYVSKEALLKFICDDVSYTLACDPSLGKAALKGDYSAIIVLAKDNKTNVCYVIEADIRRRSIEELMQDILSYAGRYRLTNCVIESNGFQSLILKGLEKEALKQNIFLPLKEVHNTSDKTGRIHSLRPYINNKSLQFDKNHPLLIEQLCLFPHHKYDDGPDALEMAFTAAQDSGQITVWHAGMDKRTANGDWLSDYRKNLWSRRNF